MKNIHIVLLLLFSFCMVNADAGNKSQAKGSAAVRKVNNAQKAKIDRNKDGQISRREVNNWNASKVDTRWEAKVDTNNNGRVDVKEKKAAAENYLENKSEVDRKWEAKADKNSDGKVDAAELRKWSGS